MPMVINKVQLRAPIWGSQSVGVAEWRLRGDMIEVEVMYKDRNGHRVYPLSFRMSTTRARTYPVQVRRGVRLHIIPLADFQEVGHGYQSREGTGNH